MSNTAITIAIAGYPPSRPTQANPTAGAKAPSNVIGAVETAQKTKKQSIY